MAVRPIGGYDPSSGWDPDESTGVNWDSDVDIPGQFRSGQGFRWPAGSILSGGSAPPRGLTINSTNGATINPDEILSPNRGINPTRQVGPWTGGTATDANASFFGQPSGLPWYLRGIGTPFGMGAAAAGIANAGISNEAAGANAGLINPHGTGPQYNTSNLPLSPNGPLPGPGRAPSGPAGPTIPMGMPGRGIPVSQNQTGGIGSDANAPLLGAGGFPTQYGAPGQQPAPLAPDGLPAPGGIGSDANIPLKGGASPGRARARPAPGGAVVKQRPNLGAYGAFTTIQRPNMPANAGGRGGGGPPQMTALDLSRLFGNRS